MCLVFEGGAALYRDVKLGGRPKTRESLSALVFVFGGGTADIHPKMTVKYPDNHETWSL
jgi:hypothetical protein